MTKFRKYLVAVFATLLAVAANATDVPYGTNLLQNTNPAGTTYYPWVKIDAGSGWAISDGKFLSSYEECVLTQTVNLKDLGLTTEQTDSLSMLAWVNYEIPLPSTRQSCIAKAFITCKDADGTALSVQTLLDINQSNIEVSATVATKLFLLPKGTTQLVYEVHGQSQVWWTGQYGPRFWGMYVGFEDMTKTYTASVVASLGDSLILSKTVGIKILDTVTVTSKYSDVRIKSISSENSGVISSNQAICTGADMIVSAEFYRKHSIDVSSSEYGTITVKKDAAFCGDTITVSHTMNGDTVRFAGYTTTPDITWLNDSTFIMVDEDVTIGMEVIKVHGIPFCDGFENGNTQGQNIVGWLQQSEYGNYSWTANNTETSYKRTPYSGSWNATLFWGNTDWLFTPVNLVKGERYVFSIYARQNDDDASGANITAKIGTADNKDSMKQVILVETGVVNGDYQRLVSSFTADTGGVCWLGIRGYLNSSPMYLSIDSVCLKKAEIHNVNAENEYGTIAVKKDAAFYGDTITVSHTMNGDTVRFAGYTTTPNLNWLTDSTFIMVDEDVTIGMKAYIKHSIVASSEYGTITVKKDAAFYGDTITVSHTMNGDTVRFAGYTTTPNLNWLTDSTFIMVDEDVTIGMKAYVKHSIVASSEYGTITVKKDAAFYGDTITVSHTMNGDTVLFAGYTTTPNLNWLTDSTFIMVDEDVTIGMEVIKVHGIPFCDGFENGNTQGQNIVGWLQQSEKGNEVWVANSTETSRYRTPYSGSWNATLYESNTDWLFTPVNLVKGARYVFSVYARQSNSDASHANISAKIGTTADKDSMKQVILAETSVVNGDYQRLVGSFTADTGGVCWLGIRGYIGSWPYWLSIDSVCLKKAEIHKINIAENEYGTIAVKKDAAFYGDTITVSHTMNGDTVLFAGYTTTPNLNWLTDSTFIMVDEDVTLGMKAYRKHSIVASASEYGTIAVKKDAAFCGDTITVSHTMNSDTVRFAGYTTTPNLNWLTDSTFIMVDEDVTIGMEVIKVHGIPFCDGFENGNTQGQNIVGWLQQSEKGNYSWTANSTGTSYKRTPYSGSWNATLLWGNTDWLFTPVNLVKGERYVFSIYARQNDDDASDANISAKIGTAADKDSMKQVILVETGVVDGDYQRLVSSFTADMGGVCWLGIRGYLNSPMYLSIDSVCLKKDEIHKINIAENEYGTITVKKDAAFYGDTITVSHTMNGDTVLFVGYTTTPDITWLNDSTFIMVDEDVTIGMEVIKGYGIPFCDGFENGNTQGQNIVGWLQQSEKGNYSWTANSTGTFYNRTPYSGSWNATLLWGNTDWLFTPVNLVKGERYVFSIYARQNDDDASDANISAKIGTAADKDSMKQFVLAETGVVDGDYQRLVSSFTADTGGVCWLGIRGYLNSSPMYLSIDSVCLKKAEIHNVNIAENEYGTIAVKKDAAFCGDIIVVSHTLNSDTVRFAGYTTTPNLNWLTDSTFIMVDEDVTIGMKAYRKHSVVASASEYGTIAVKKDAAFYGDTITVSHTLNSDTVRFAGYTTTPNLTWLTDSTFIMVDEDVTICMKAYRKHSVVASASEYGTIAVKKDAAFCGDTIVVSHTMNGDIGLFAGYTTTPNLNWLNDSTFIMVDEDVTIGMKAYRKHSVVASASEYGTITIKKDAAFCGDTITVSHAMNGDTVRFAGYTTMPDITWLNDSTFIMVDEDVTICMHAYGKNLLQNTNPDGTTYDPWVKKNGWAISNGKFLSSSSECVLTQTVNLNDLGLTTAQTDSLSMLAMVNYEIPWPGGYNCIAKVIVTCKDAAGNNLSVQTLLDINQKNIEVSATVATKLFLLPQGTTQLVYEVHGKDQKLWSGYYGPAFWNMYLGFTDLKNYTITIAECENGSVASNKATAQMGDTVKLTITSDLNFDLDKVAITQGESQVNFNDKDSTFIMPAGDVTISVTFKQSTDVEDVKVLNLYVADGRIYCEGEFRIYDLLGRDVTAMNGSLRGVYVVRTKDAFRKVIVK